MKLKELADVIRSKNAGIQYITIDVMFGDDRLYTAVKETNSLTTEKVAELYDIEETEVQFFEYDAGNSFKFTLPRDIAAGNFGDSDVFGAQQHGPIRDIEVPMNHRNDHG